MVILNRYLLSQSDYLYSSWQESGCLFLCDYKGFKPDTNKGTAHCLHFEEEKNPASAPELFAHTHTQEDILFYILQATASH